MFQQAGIILGVMVAVYVIVRALRLTTELSMFAAAVAGGSELASLGVPLLLVYAFLGARILLKAPGGERILYTVLVGLCGLMLLQQQMHMGTTVKPIMQQTRETTGQLRSASLWLREHASGRETVATERPWVVSYLTRMEVRSIDSPQSVDSDFLVTSGAAAIGYLLVYEPPAPGRWSAARSVAVWRKE